MTAHKCHDCGYLGEALEQLVTVRPDEFGPVDQVQVSCPRCASDHVEEVVLCLGCKAAEPEDGDDYCKGCLQTYQNVGDRQDRLVADYQRRNAA